VALSENGKQYTTHLHGNTDVIAVPNAVDARLVGEWLILSYRYIFGCMDVYANGASLGCAVGQ
jgi:hypothetical protein